MGTSTRTSPENLGILNQSVKKSGFLAGADRNDVFAFSIDKQTDLTVNSSIYNSLTFTGKVNVGLRLAKDSDGDGQLDDNEIIVTKSVPESNTNQQVLRQTLSPGKYFLEFDVAGFRVTGNYQAFYFADIIPAGSITLPNLAITPTNAVQAEGNSGTKPFTFTVTRSGNTTGTNTVNWTVAGTGTNPANATDFGGTLPSGILTFAANETSKVITVNVNGDITQESNETFTVTLSNATNGTNITTATATGTIQNDDFIGNSSNNTLTGTAGNDYINGGAGRDTLTGGTGSDIFVFQFGQSLVSGADRITDFAIGTDKIDLLTSSGVAMNAPTSFTRAANSTATTLANMVNSVFTDVNGALTGNQALGVNSAALVSVTTAGIAGTYLVINDGVAGFQSSNDLLVNMTGYTGTLPALGNIAVSSFFI
ncbi:MAG: bluetail domain-containing putative surface protein [Aphanizomenon gracile PMC649.10]|nr:bluetail domain-containing putative surface protein [Aphanizomenon gracile PMC627.10]MDM3854677.1 bluetail domain-containing putative surface protein [Aphanizomenon gracile PMC649.10]MDM3859328.1 bluetail domain-containing putative surface protein [Aphanizomenon gracile PMC644.10]